MKKYTVMIIYGGEGYESEISKSSACLLEKIKQDDRFLPIFVYISKDGRWYLSKKSTVSDDPCELVPLVLSRGGFVSGGRYVSVDFALAVMHGDRGEDGYITACLSHFRIRSIGSPYYTASLVRDKAAVKLFARDIGIDTADFAYFPEGKIPTEGELSAIVRSLGFPLFVKPRRLGSSVGASRADNMAELISAVNRAGVPFSGGVIIERFVPARFEAECGFLEDAEGEKFAVGAVLTEGREYSYERKYLGLDGIRAIDHYPEDPSERDIIIERSRRLVEALGIRRMCRVDFFVTRDSRIIFNEINLIPGFTEESLFPRLFFGGDLSLADWLYRVCERELGFGEW